MRPVDPFLELAGVQRLDRDVFARRNSAWHRAQQREQQADAFCCRAEWLLAFHDTHYPARPLFLLRANDSQIAVAAHRGPRGAARIEPLECHWLFGNPLLGPHAVELLIELAQAWHAAEGVAPELLISGLLPGSERYREVLAAFARRGTVYGVPPSVSCSASLAGGLDGYLSRRSAKHRRALRQAQRRARERGVTFERLSPTTVAAADRAYSRMIAVERASWKGSGHCGMAEPPSLQFYAELLRRMARSNVARTVFARCGEQDIGFMLGGVAHGTFRGQQFSYVQDWANASIGNLLQHEQLAWLCEEGAHRYDMGPRMDYKLHWTEIETVAEALLCRP